jgi:hypothetical protein
MARSSRMIWITSLVVFLNTVQGAEIPCKELDFNQFALNGIGSCTNTWTQTFKVKSYKDNGKVPLISEKSLYYMSNEWEGLTCGETKDTFSLNKSSEIRVTYSLLYYEGAKLEIRILNLDQLSTNNNPKVVDKWVIAQNSEGWTTFKIPVAAEIKRAKVSNWYIASVYFSISISLVTSWIKDFREFYFNINKHLYN